MLHQTHTDVEKHAMIWCISHLVPLRQFRPGELNIVFYENLCLRPHSELAQIEQMVKRRFSPSAFASLSKPSATTTASSAILTGDNQVARWRNSLSASEIRQVLDIVAGFGLDHLYGDGLLPRDASTAEATIGSTGGAQVDFA
jgi:hypothetical protein